VGPLNGWCSLNRAIEKGGVTEYYSDPMLPITAKGGEVHAANIDASRYM